MRLKELGEDNIIKSLTERFARKHPRVLMGIGDDTSVTVQKGGKALLATTDILVEDTHFKRSNTTPYLLGRKALTISVSDIIAMGGEPLFYLSSIVLRPETAKGFVDELYRGLGAAGKEYGCALIGGNTARTSGAMMISTTVLGEVPSDEAVYRDGAEEGDIIFVTGALGDSALGLKSLKDARLKKRYKNAVSRHLDPIPRVSAGKALARGRLASAMMDISDGLGLDLKRLCDASRVSAVVGLAALPVSDELKRYAKGSEDAIIELAFSGGEDYELLFTSPESNIRKIAALSRKLRVPITPIGKIIPRNKSAPLTVIGSEGMPLVIKKLGFEHF